MTDSGHGHGHSLAGRLRRRLAAPASGGGESCAVCGQPIPAEGHAVRRADGLVHADCVLYRGRRARVA